VVLHTTQSLHRVGHRCTASSSSTTDTKSTPSSSSTTSPREQRACFPFRLCTHPIYDPHQVYSVPEFFIYYKSTARLHFCLGYIHIPSTLYDQHQVNPESLCTTGPRDQRALAVKYTYADAWCGRNVCTAVVMCVDVEMYVGQVELFGDVDDGIGVVGV
jgi:hypothetical protein